MCQTKFPTLGLALIPILIIILLVSPKIRSLYQINTAYIKITKIPPSSTNQNTKTNVCLPSTNLRRQSQCLLLKQDFDSLQNIIDLMPADSPIQQMVVVQLGNVYRNTGHEQEAIAMFQDHNAFIHLTRWGVEAYEAEEFDSALTLLTAVKDSTDKSQISDSTEQEAVFDALSTLANIYKAEKNHAAEIAVYQTQLSVYPDLAPLYQSYIYRHIGEAYRSLEQYDVAQTWLEEAQQLAPNDSRPTYELGRVTADQENWQAAIQLFQQAANQKPSISEPYYDMGIVYEKMSEPEAARQAYENAIALSGDKIYYRQALGELCEQLNCLDVAVSQYCQILQLEPDNQDAQNHLSTLQESNSTNNQIDFSCSLINK